MHVHAHTREYNAAVRRPLSSVCPHLACPPESLVPTAPFLPALGKEMPLSSLGFAFQSSCAVECWATGQKHKANPAAATWEGPTVVY